MTKLSILIPALASRPWHAIRDELQRQATAAGNAEVLVDVDDGEMPSGVKRQRLMRRAVGEYVAFVDDDDRVDPHYVTELITAMRSQPDVVTFNLLFRCVKPLSRTRGRPFYMPDEVWHFGLHADDRKQGLMTANHLCAWKRELASRVAWCPDLGNGDDQLWYQPIRASGLVHTEAHIDKVLYHYLFDPSATVNQQVHRRRRRERYIGDGLRCFRDADGEIYIEVGDREGPPASLARLRDRHNHVVQLDTSRLEHFHTIQVK